MIKRTNNDLKKSIIKQKAYTEYKDKDLIIHSIKVYEHKSFDDTVTVKASELQKALKIKKNDVIAFRSMFYNLCRSDKLAIDSASEKQNLCKHARARQHCFNQIARAIKRDDLIVEYKKESKEQAKQEVKQEVKTSTQAKKQTKRVKAKVKTS